jgi:hypothetical protein
LAFGTAARAQSIFLTYEQWEQLPTTLREIYVAGAIDQLSTVGHPAGLSLAKHYNECIVKSGMRLGQVAEGTKKFMEMHSDQRQEPAPIAVMQYLITLCGSPTPDEGALLKGFSSAEVRGELPEQPRVQYMPSVIASGLLMTHVAPTDLGAINRWASRFNVSPTMP